MWDETHGLEEVVEVQGRNPLPLTSYVESRVKGKWVTAGLSGWWRAQVGDGRTEWVMAGMSG